PRGRDAARPGRAASPAAAGGEGAGDRQPRVQPGLAHGDGPAQPADGFRGGDAGGAVAQGEPRGAVPRRLPAPGLGEGREGELGGLEGRRRQDADPPRPDPGDARGAEGSHPRGGGGAVARGTAVTPDLSPGGAPQ